jgi:tetratricopeptide (TPR) repeat protein
LYLERARAEGARRYFARAEALLQPWAKGPDARDATLRVQADILQNRHDFDGALKLLDRVIARNPRDASARLMSASVKLVQGRASEARADCAAVLANGESAAGTVCLAQVLGATGHLLQAEALVRALLERDVPEHLRLAESAPASSERVQSAASPARLPARIRGWALWSLADFADRAGDSAAAETFLRSALDAVPESEGVRSALSDLLLARGAHREAMAVVDIPAPSVGLLARRARAQSLLRDPAITGTRARIDDLLTLSKRRGEGPHLREEALIALYLDHDGARALKLAKANFELQRETLDVRLLSRAARATADAHTLGELEKWLRETGYEDRALSRAPS